MDEEKFDNTDRAPKHEQAGTRLGGLFFFRRGRFVHANFNAKPSEVANQ